MPRTDANINALLDAARGLISAREDGMITSAEWDELERSLAACEAPDEPNATGETPRLDDHAE